MMNDGGIKKSELDIDWILNVMLNGQAMDAIDGLAIRLCK